jgi:putative CocE/NonD family hydrolase
VLCDAPADASALIAALMGYATVGVNMRGTGCSGGAYDFFEPLQLLDGYDVIETVAAQAWVKAGRVGMTGLSYPGITQMFVAKTHPPHLAAIRRSRS